MRDAFLEYLKQPNRARYTLFVLAYGGPVTRLVRRLMSSPDLVEDVTQETFLRLGRTQVRPERVLNPKAFVLRTALNIAKQEVQKEAVRARHEKSPKASRRNSCPSALDEAITEESIGRL